LEARVLSSRGRKARAEASSAPTKPLCDSAIAICPRERRAIYGERREPHALGARGAAPGERRKRRERGPSSRPGRNSQKSLVAALAPAFAKVTAGRRDDQIFWRAGERGRRGHGVTPRTAPLGAKGAAPNCGKSIQFPRRFADPGATLCRLGLLLRIGGDLPNRTACRRGASSSSGGALRAALSPTN
jgi:hypothetical protein